MPNYKDPKEDEKEQRLMPEGYPKVVYHKDYDFKKFADNAHGVESHEKAREKLSKVVKSDEELKALGADWDDHPNAKPKEVKPKASIK